MKTIDITSPEGNVFYILGYAQKLNKIWPNPVISDVLTNYFDMKYDDILDKLESTNQIRFTNRNKLKKT